MAKYDLPSTIQFVLAHSTYDKLAYVGHSEGTIQAFAGFSLAANTEVSNSVVLFGALAPVAYVSHQESPLIQLFADVHFCDLLALLGDRRFLEGEVLNLLAPKLCQKTPDLCVDVLDLIVGPSTHYNETRLQVYLSATPAGTSVRNMRHWGQNIRKNVFSMYDYELPLLNHHFYGSHEPPAYDLSNMRVPTALFSGGNDYLADPKDVDQLRAALNSTGSLILDIEVEDYAHLDFTWAPDAAELIYPEFVDLLLKRHPLPEI